MFVNCVCVTFSVKDFSGATWPRILKPGKHLCNYKLYCVRNNQPHITYKSGNMPKIKKNVLFSETRPIPFFGPDSKFFKAPWGPLLHTGDFSFYKSQMA